MSSLADNGDALMAQTIERLAPTAGKPHFSLFTDNNQNNLQLARRNFCIVDKSADCAWHTAGKAGMPD